MSIMNRSATDPIGVPRKSHFLNAAVKSFARSLDFFLSVDHDNAPRAKAGIPWVRWDAMESRRSGRPIFPRALSQIAGACFALPGEALQGHRAPVRSEGRQQGQQVFPLSIPRPITRDPRHRGTRPCSGRRATQPNMPPRSGQTAFPSFMVMLKDEHMPAQSPAVRAERPRQSRGDAPFHTNRAVVPCSLPFSFFTRLYHFHRPLVHAGQPAHDAFSRCPFGSGGGAFPSMTSENRIQGPAWGSSCCFWRFR